MSRRSSARRGRARDTASPSDASSRQTPAFAGRKESISSNATVPSAAYERPASALSTSTIRSQSPSPTRGRSRRGSVTSRNSGWSTGSVPGLDRVDEVDAEQVPPELAVGRRRGRDRLDHAQRRLRDAVLPVVLDAVARIACVFAVDLEHGEVARAGAVPVVLGIGQAVVAPPGLGAREHARASPRGRARRSAAARGRPRPRRPAGRDRRAAGRRGSACGRARPRSRPARVAIP